jgi:hypothetical protein
VGDPETDGKNAGAFASVDVSGPKVDGNDAAPAASDSEEPINQLLARHDHAARDALMISFLYEAYEPKYWYWEVVETTRRLMLTAVLSVCGPGTSAQALLAVLLALLYIKLYGHFAPYLKSADDTVAETGQFQIFLSFLGALVYQRHLLGKGWDSSVGSILILINMSVIVLFVYFAGTTLYREVQAADLKQLTVRAPDKPVMSPRNSVSNPRAGVNLAKVYIAPNDAHDDPAELPQQQHARAAVEESTSSVQGEV